MSFIISLLVNAAIVFIVAHFMPSIKVRNYGSALIVALLIGLLNATVGALLRFPLNLVTLFLLGFLVRLFVTAVVIKIVDKIVSGFEVKGFTPALILAVIMAIVGSLFDFA